MPNGPKRDSAVFDDEFCCADSSWSLSIWSAGIGSGIRCELTDDLDDDCFKFGGGLIGDGMSGDVDDDRCDFEGGGFGWLDDDAADDDESDDTCCFAGDEIEDEDKGNTMGE